METLSSFQQTQKGAFGQLGSWAVEWGRGGIPKLLKTSFLTGSQVFIGSSGDWNAGGRSLRDFGLCCWPGAGETFRNAPLAFQSHLWPHLLFTLIFLPSPPPLTA